MILFSVSGATILLADELHPHIGNGIEQPSQVATGLELEALVDLATRLQHEQRSL
jgi:hypothetical protein